MKNKTLIIVVLIISTFLTLNIFIDNINADSGWDTDYDSGSSFDSGSSSWDNDYDYDSDNDWDSSSSSGSTCTTQECKNANLILLITYTSVFFVILILILLRSFPKKTKNTKLQNKINKMKEGITYKDATAIIPDFNIEEFNFYAYKVFYDVQMAWMNFDYNKLKELLTDELYNMYVSQLEPLKLKNQRNVMDKFILNSCNIFDLKEENGVYIAKVCLDVSFVDYIESLKTGIILRGGTYKRVNNIYILTFIKSKNETAKVNICPRCGASVEGNTTGICKYCKSKLINSTYDWVMSKKEKISQK